ncbi:hypothetical protein ACR6C2_42935 [Streptomyces sp. INA 01156]
MGQARYVIVYRALAQQQSGRLSAAVSSYFFDEHYRAHGLVSPAQVCALRTQRMIEHDGVPAEALRAFARPATSTPGATRWPPDGTYG